MLASSVAAASHSARTIDTIDFAVGCSALKKIGARVERDEPLCTIHARDETSLRNARSLFESAVEITPDAETA